VLAITPLFSDIFPSIILYTTVSASPVNSKLEALILPVKCPLVAYTLPSLSTPKLEPIVNRQSFFGVGLPAIVVAVYKSPLGIKKIVPFTPI